MMHPQSVIHLKSVPNELVIMCMNHCVARSVTGYRIKTHSGSLLCPDTLELCYSFLRNPSGLTRRLLKQLYHTISDFQWGCRSEQAGWCTDEATGWFTVVCFGKSLTKPCSHTASSTPTTDLRHYFIQPCHRSTCTEIFVLQPLTGHFVYY